jgi:hypothetical protein
MTLADMIRKFGVNAKLKKAVMRQRGWNPADWYRQWPTFGAELELAIREARS